MPKISKSAFASSRRKFRTSRNNALRNGALLCLSFLLITGIGVAIADEEQTKTRNSIAAKQYAPATTQIPVSSANHVTLPGEGSKAFVIGDSYTYGTGADDKDQGSWAARAVDTLQWEATILGIPGTGFVNGGKTGEDQFINRIKNSADTFEPDVVVIQGGQNDHSASSQELRDAVSTTIRAAKGAWPKANLIVVGPTAPQPLGAMLGRIATPIAQAAKEEGAVSVDPVRRQWITSFNSDKYDYDGSHVNDAGHAYLAEKFVEIVRNHQD